MKEEEILKILKNVGAILTDGHFVYASYMHGDVYVNKDALFKNVLEVSFLCNEIYSRFSNEKIDVVIGPAVGGAIMAQWVAYAFERAGRSVYATYADKSDDGKSYVIKRGYDNIIKDQNVLVVEDVLNTGISARLVVDAVRKCGGNVVGLGAIFNRGGVGLKDVAYPPKIKALVNIKLETWNADDCPLCKNNIHFNTDFGRGRELLAYKK